MGGRLRSLGGSITCDRGAFTVGFFSVFFRICLTLPYGVVSRWLTLGNQLGGDQIFEEDLAARIRTRSVHTQPVPTVVKLTRRPKSGILSAR